MVIYGKSKAKEYLKLIFILFRIMYKMNQNKLLHSLDISYLLYIDFPEKNRTSNKICHFLNFTLLYYQMMYNLVKSMLGLDIICLLNVFTYL